MNFFQAIGSVMSKGATFSGRACRSEYWYWILFLFLLFVVVDLFFSLAFVLVGAADVDGEHLASAVYWVFQIVFFLPNLALGVRRLHDLDQSGWWVVPALMPFIGVLPFCFRGTRGPNRFGPDPLGGHAIQTVAEVFS